MPELNTESFKHDIKGKGKWNDKIGLKKNTEVLNYFLLKISGFAYLQSCLKHRLPAFCSVSWRKANS